MDLNVKEDLMNQAIKISKNINKLNLASEHNQFSIAATSMLVMGENNNIPSMTKKRLREMFGVSEVTISKTYKKIEKIKHILSDDIAVEKVIVKIKQAEEDDDEEIDPIILERMKKFNIKPENTETKVKLIVSTKEKEKLIMLKQCSK
jgi:hypothetical protein